MDYEDVISGNPELLMKQTQIYGVLYNYSVKYLRKSSFFEIFHGTKTLNCVVEYFKK